MYVMYVRIHVYMYVNEGCVRYVRLCKVCMYGMYGMYVSI